MFWVRSAQIVYFISAKMNLDIYSKKTVKYSKVYMLILLRKIIHICLISFGK